MKNRSIARVALAGSVMAGAAVGGAATVANVGAQDDPATSIPEDAAVSDEHPGKGDHLRDVLDGLVEDETLTPEQADKVAAALEEARPERGTHREGHGRRGAGRGEIAEALGMEPSELRDALADGQSLAEVAESQGVDPQSLIDSMTASMDERLSEAVESGRLTQEEADAKKMEMVERATAMVNGELRDKGFGPRDGRGPRGGHGAGHHDGVDDVDGDASEEADDADD